MGRRLCPAAQCTRRGDSRAVLKPGSLPLLFQTQEEGDALMLAAGPPAALPSPGPGARAVRSTTPPQKTPDAWFLETGRPLRTVLLLVNLRTAPVHLLDSQLAPAETSSLGMAV